MDKIVVGPLTKGMQTDVIPLNVDQDAFPTLYNAYTWRGRVKRKRGTEFLGVLTRQAESVVGPPQSWQVIALGVIDGAGNLSVNLQALYSLPANSTITPGSINITDGVHTWTDPALDGTLSGTGGASGTINYATTAISLSGGTIGNSVAGTFSYYPHLPVMGLENFFSGDYSFPSLLAFDTRRSYQITNADPATFYNTSYYKSTNTPFEWSGADYQQFWTTNYQGALWATNGRPGFQFQAIQTISSATPAVITTATAHNLISGDYVFFNELTGADANIVNLQTVPVTVITPTSFSVPIAAAGKTINNSGIFQTLTHTKSNISGDGIRWYDGDPTGGTGLPIGNGKGWVNFAPPLTATVVSINSSPQRLWYLTGANAIVPFKDRLVFFGVTIQASDGTSLYMADTALWSWNGTPYYTSTGTSGSYTPALVPVNETAVPSAFYVDQVGFGGYLSAGITQAIVSVVSNDDVLIVGFTGSQTRFVYTSNDLSPFLFYSVNQEYGTAATFSGISLDRGALAYGTFGFTMTTQNGSERIDLQIPQEAFNFSQLHNASARMSAARDFTNEWVYFSFVPDSSTTNFPTQLLQYNYREQSWAVFYENYTTFGPYFPAVTYTWATLPFRRWDLWNVPWNTVLAEEQQVVGGTPQGYVVIKGIGTEESVSGHIQAITNPSLDQTQITSVNHCMQTGDYILISGCTGSTFLNGTIYQVTYIDGNTFQVDAVFVAGTYTGLGQYAKLSKPLIQTKQFSPYASQGRQVRLGVQRYLLENSGQATADDQPQITLNINLSQDDSAIWNMGPVVPDVDSTNNALVSTQILFTCPEPNNLQMPTGAGQKQIWHRMNTSLIGESVQLGFTLSDAQMRDINYSQDEIVLHGFILDTAPGPSLA